MNPVRKLKKYLKIMKSHHMKSENIYSRITPNLIF